jgi:transcriptional regulator with XRE-family HTH domain
MKKTKKVTLRTAGPVDKYIGIRMRERRVALGVSQADLAAKLGITFQQIQKYENGTNRVSAARLFDLCEALGISLASMFEREVNLF